jgi:hypothetical protein
MVTHVCTPALPDLHPGVWLARLDPPGDAELTPQPIQQPRPTDRPRVADLHRPAARGQPHLTPPRGLLAAVAEVRPDRRRQPPQPVHVDRLDPTQVHQHLRPGHPVDAMVVHQRDVPHHRAVGVPPLREPQAHAHTKPSRPRYSNHERASRVTTLSTPRAQFTWSTTPRPAPSRQRSSPCAHELRNPGYSHQPKITPLKMTHSSTGSLCSGVVDVSTIDGTATAASPPRTDTDVN